MQECPDVPAAVGFIGLQTESGGFWSRHGVGLGITGGRVSSLSQSSPRQRGCQEAQNIGQGWLAFRMSPPCEPKPLRSPVTGQVSLE